MSSNKINDIIEQLSELKVIEAAELTKALEEKWGVSASVPVAVASANADNATAETAAAKTEFDIVLSAPGDKKINVIKIVREITALGLKDAKELVDSAPKPIKEGVSKEEAEEIKKKLEEVGASVEIK